ncbi:KTSC domain protein [Klebsiella variicola]|nr:KTSC domain protein [Klebsiella variicola]
MHHHPVKSSRIISVAYDDASATLEIYFITSRRCNIPACHRVFSVTFYRWCQKDDFMTA